MMFSGFGLRQYPLRQAWHGFAWVPKIKTPPPLAWPRCGLSMRHSPSEPAGPELSTKSWPENYLSLQVDFDPIPRTQNRSTSVGVYWRCIIAISYFVRTICICMKTFAESLVKVTSIISMKRLLRIEPLIMATTVSIARIECIESTAYRS